MLCYTSGLGPNGIDLTNYPDREYQLNWIRDYLACKGEVTVRPVTEVTDDTVEDCYVKVNKFALVSCEH